MNAKAPSRKVLQESDPPERWSQKITQGSHALELEPGVFTWNNPRAIAQSLKASAERSQSRKATPFRSAMSMLSFYINRAGSQLSADQRARLEVTKDELRVLFDRRPRQSTEVTGKPSK